jgi:hypothetical protein
MISNSTTVLCIQHTDLDAVTGGNGFVDGAKRIGDTVVKGSGYGAAAGAMGGFVVGGPAGAGTGAGVGAAGGAAFGLGWAAAREIDQAVNKTGAYAPKKK